MQERLAYIALNMMPGIGPVGVRRLISALGSPAAVWSATEEELLAVRGMGDKTVGRLLRDRDSVDPEAEERRAIALGVSLVTPLDMGYPKQLSTLHDPPLVLYVRGSLEATDTRSVAVVGSRSASAYGLATADRLGYQLGQCGVCVVSGLARGIDQAAHRGALKGGGRTVAVLGSAIDRLYPAESEGLAEEIARQGAVVSEYPLEREADRQTFPYRNRIVSGLSLGTVVVESDRKGGSMHTADAAMEQGRAVFAVPGRVDLPGSRGPHYLLKNGARLVESAEDVLAEFEFDMPQLTEAEGMPAVSMEVVLSPEERRVMEALWQAPLQVDELGRACALSSSVLSGILLSLEMKRVLRSLPGGVVELRSEIRNLKEVE